MLVEHIASGAGSHGAVKERRDALPAPSFLGADADLHLLHKLGGFDPLASVAVPPGFEHLDYVSPVGIALLCLSNAFDRIAATEREQRVAAPLGPNLISCPAAYPLSTALYFAGPTARS